MASSAERIRWRGTTESRWDVGGRIVKPGDVVLVARHGVHRWLVFNCPCGCGDQVPINLDRRTGPAWRAFHPGRRLTVYPSIWRGSGCESHFIVRRGQILLVSDYSWGQVWTIARPLREAVLDRLREAPIHFSEIADAIGEEPWDVLDACRELENSGKALEASGDPPGRFIRIS